MRRTAHFSSATATIQNRDNGGYNSRDSVTYGNITADINPSPLYTFYARVGGELISPRGQGRDFNANYYTGDSGFRGALALDQFGVLYHDVNQGLVITVGRQDQPLDATGTAYDQSFKVGLHTFLDGVSVVKKIGKGTAEGYAFSEDQYRLIDGQGRATRNGLYALRGTYKPSGQVTLGGLVARFLSSGVNKAAGVQTTTNYEGDVSLQAAPNLLLKAEYGRSDARTRNDLYYGLAKYSFTGRDSFTVYTYKIGQNADVGQDAGYPNANRGTRYFIEHDFDIRTSLIVYHETDRQLYAHGKSNSDQVSLVYTF